MLSLASSSEVSMKKTVNEEIPIRNRVSTTLRM